MVVSSLASLGRRPLTPSRRLTRRCSHRPPCDAAVLSLGSTIPRAIASTPLPPSTLLTTQRCLHTPLQTHQTADWPKPAPPHAGAANGQASIQHDPTASAILTLRHTGHCSHRHRHLRRRPVRLIYYNKLILSSDRLTHRHRTDCLLCIEI